MEEDNPFIEAFNKILFEEEINNKPSNQYILNDQNKLNNQDINMIEENPIVNNPIEGNEDEDMNSNNNSKEENPNQNENNNDDKLELSPPNSLLGKKTKPDNDLDSLQITSMNNNLKNQNINKNEPKSISVINNENKIEEYDYGYSIILLNEGETGLIEDFFNEKQSESTTPDYFNFHLDEEKWIKILNHSIYIHYERHIKDEIEKRKKMQMYMNNGNNNPNPQIMAPMNPMMYMNMGNMSNMANMSNGVNYQQMYLQNLKNMPNQFNLMNK